LVTNYFPSSRQAKILSLKQSLDNATLYSPAARTFGFEIMDSIGSVSRSFSIDPAAGGHLTVALIGCMFENAFTFTYPEDDAVSAFTAALNSAEGGAYYVRGGGVGGVDAEGRSGTVLGTLHPLGGTAVNLSGIKPSSGSWTTMLAGNAAGDGRVLIYGYSVPNTPALVYDWAGVPSAPTFSPPAVVSVCDDDNSGTAMVHEEDIGVLAYVETNICQETQTLTSAEFDWGAKALALRLGRMLVNAVTPEPLQATVLLTKGGGTTTTAPKSKFGKKSVTALSMEWKDNPGVPSTWNGTKAAQARATSAYVSAIADGVSQAVRFCAYLSGTNNNGFPTKLVKDSDPQRDPECTTPPNGDPNALSVVTRFDNENRSVADFGKVFVTKTGNIIITLSVVSGAVANASLITQANVKPLK
jgi:hypothetical protein